MRQTYWSSVTFSTEGHHLVILKENDDNGVPDLINNDKPYCSVTGDPAPGELLNFRNGLTILSLTADFDRAVLFCGSSDLRV